ncbi:hypothetical protein PHYBOEH_006483 [Phytophthora boehmeriae]|uniref:Uncharacterized protein n=1 Tax=Phytophthora boehmeriae TaxID=109152 RepID=A0A8T1WD67_9STRA|nr:hypothetical protein PHYBOEH_006483 [Phytophthora boehmeriae]
MNPMSFVLLYPDAAPYIDCLIRTRLATEHDDGLNEAAEVMPGPSSVALPAATTSSYSHALVKQSRVQFEYVVGEDADVARAIGDSDIVFYESLESINPAYLSRIHGQLAEVLRHEKKRMVTFSGRSFNYKPKAKTNFESIVRIYKTAHN